MVDGILKVVQHLGSIILFKAYVEITLDPPNSKTMLLHSVVWGIIDALPTQWEERCGRQDDDR